MRVSNRPPQSISSSDSGSLSLGFKSPISIGGVLFNLERTTLHRKQDTHQSDKSNFIIVIIDLKKNLKTSESQTLQNVMPQSRFSPADHAIKHAHDEQGEAEVPRVAHGDEHHVVVIAEVPLRPVRRVKHKTNLRRQRGAKKKKVTSERSY